MKTDVAGILSGTELLRSVPAEELKAVAAASRVRTFRRGQVVFTRNDPGDTVIVVISGRVKVVMNRGSRHAARLTSAHRGGRASRPPFVLRRC
jgi:CRP-like cAMP-binding protein